MQGYSYGRKLRFQSCVHLKCGNFSSRENDENIYGLVYLLLATTMCANCNSKSTKVCLWPNEWPCAWNTRQFSLNSSRPRRDDLYNFEVVQSIASSSEAFVPFQFSLKGGPEGSIQFWALLDRLFKDDTVSSFDNRRVSCQINICTMRWVNELDWNVLNILNYISYLALTQNLCVVVKS